MARKARGRGRAASQLDWLAGRWLAALALSLFRCRRTRLSAAGGYGVPFDIHGSLNCVAVEQSAQPHLHTRADKQIRGRMLGLARDS